MNMSREEFLRRYPNEAHQLGDSQALARTVNPGFRIGTSIPTAADKAQQALIDKTLGTEKRLRQSTGPKMNKTETAFYELLCSQFKPEWVFSQMLGLRLANGCIYWPDFIVKIPVPSGFSMIAYEVKGPVMRDDAAVKIKVAASIYKDIKFTLVWRKAGEWKTQEIIA